MATPVYSNIGATAIRTGAPKTRLPFQSHNSCQIVDEDYVQKSSAFSNAARLSSSALPTASVALDGSGHLDSITITSAGSGYTSPPSITVNGDGAAAVVSAVLEGDKLSSIAITNAGNSYTTATLTIAAPTSSKAWLRSDTNPDAILVAESGTTGIGCGLLKFTRTFSEIPPQRIEYEQVSYQQPALYSTASVESKPGFTALTLAKVTYDYFLTATVTDIPLATATQVTEKTPTVMNSVGGNVVLANDDSLSRWMGDIWERKKVEVTIQSA